MRTNYIKDSVTWKVSSDCLGDYAKVGVSVEASVTHTDYSPARHSFHPWVDRG